MREGGSVGVVVEGGEVCVDVFPAAVVVDRTGGVEGSGWGLLVGGEIGRLAG